MWSPRRLPPRSTSPRRRRPSPPGTSGTSALQYTDAAGMGWIRQDSLAGTHVPLRAAASTPATAQHCTALPVQQRTFIHMQAPTTTDDQQPDPGRLGVPARPTGGTRSPSVWVTRTRVRTRKRTCINVEGVRAIDGYPASTAASCTARLRDQPREDQHGLGHGHRRQVDHRRARRDQHQVVLCDHRFGFGLRPHRDSWCSRHLVELDGHGHGLPGVAQHQSAGATTGAPFATTTYPDLCRHVGSCGHGLLLRGRQRNEPRHRHGRPR